MHSKSILLIVVLLTCSLNFTFCARILFILPAPSISHHIFYRPIIKELLTSGHEIVSITAVPINDSQLKNLTEIDIHKETFGVLSGQKWIEDSQYERLTEVNKMRSYLPLLRETADQVLSTPKVKQLILNQNEHFDLAVIEIFTMSAHFFGFSERFNCPAIGIATLDTSINGLDAIGNPPHPSYYGSFFTEYSGANLTFQERLLLLWHHIDFRIYYHFQYLRISDEMIVKHFNITTKTAWDLEKSVDLILTNTLPVFHISRPTVPNLIDIGGLHIPERTKLPKDLKIFLDASSQGVIYFSLGTNVKSENLPLDKRAALIGALSQLPYNILLKWDQATIDDSVENVFIKSWLPQPTVLDHPNIKAFVTQGGMHSIEEAIRSKVPMVCIPFGADQHHNARRISDLEIGRQLDFKDITKDRLVDVIIDVANNQKYRTNLINLANIMYEQPTKPLDRAIWWIEYVIRHRGAKSLRCPAADLPWYKYLLLDIIGFICIVVIFTLFVIIRLSKFMLGLIFSIKSKQKNA